MAMKTAVKRISDRDLEDLVVREKGPFGVAFMSTCSIPCDHFRAELEALPELMKNRIQFYRLDVDENPTITDDLGIDAVPTLVIYRKEEEIVRYEGPYSREALKERLENAVFKKKAD